MKKNAPKLILLLVLAGIAFYLFGGFPGQQPDKGENAPNFTGKLVQGGDFDLASLEGRYVVLSFWASWCAPCRVDVPKLIDLQNSNRDNKYEIVSIALERKAGKSELLAERLGFNWPNQVESASRIVATNPIAQKYGVTVIPSKFLIGPDGELIGNMSMEEIKEYLEAI